MIEIKKTINLIAGIFSILVGLSQIYPMINNYNVVLSIVLLIINITVGIINILIYIKNKEK